MDLLPVISCLRPNVSRAEAEQALAPGLVGRIVHGPLRAVAQAFVPFRVFRVTANVGRGPSMDQILALDAACGDFDPYGFPAVPGEDDLVKVEATNVVPEQVAESRLEKLAEDKLRRILFAKGFFRIGQLTLTVSSVGRIHVPYWLGFSGHDDEAHLTVLDAVRRQREGEKVRAFFSAYLRT